MRLDLLAFSILTGHRGSHVRPSSESHRQHHVGLQNPRVRREGSRRREEKVDVGWLVHTWRSIARWWRLQHVVWWAKHDGTSTTKEARRRGAMDGFCWISISLSKKRPLCRSKPQLTIARTRYGERRTLRWSRRINGARKRHTKTLPNAPSGPGANKGIHTRP